MVTGVIMLNGSGCFNVPMFHTKYAIMLKATSVLECSFLFFYGIMSPFYVQIAIVIVAMSGLESTV